VRQKGPIRRVVLRFDQRHAQQIGKKIAAFGLRKLDQELEHLFHIVASGEATPVCSGNVMSSSDMALTFQTLILS
jgi:hypothetical protein